MDRIRGIPSAPPLPAHQSVPISRSSFPTFATAEWKRMQSSVSQRGTVRPRTGFWKSWTALVRVRQSASCGRLLSARAGGPAWKVGEWLATTYEALPFGCRY